jgi:hypothetical protein
VSDLAGAAGGADAEGRWPPAHDASAGSPGAPAVGDSDLQQGGRTTVTDTSHPPRRQPLERQQDIPYGSGAPTPAPRPPQPHQPPQAYSPPQGGTPVDEGTMALRRPRPAAASQASRSRKARLRVSKADPWSVMKVSFLLSIALGICSIVAASVLWMVMDAIGVFSTVGATLKEATGSGTDGGFELASFLSLGNVLTFTAVVAVINVVLMTALATLATFAYNLSSGFVGGVELTLSEDE